jgi:hypothetical protein
MCVKRKALGVWCAITWYVPCCVRALDARLARCDGPGCFVTRLCHELKRLRGASILCACSSAGGVDEQVAPHPRAGPTLAPVRHPPDVPVTIMMVMSQASECYLPIILRSLVPGVEYQLGVTVQCLEGADGGASEDCADDNFREERELSVSAHQDAGSGVTQTVLLKIPPPTRASRVQVTAVVVDTFPGLSQEDGVLARANKLMRLQENPHYVESSADCCSGPGSAQRASVQGLHPIIIEWATLRSDSRGPRALVMPFHFRDASSQQKTRGRAASVLLVSLKYAACGTTKEVDASSDCGDEVLFSSGTQVRAADDAAAGDVRVNTPPKPSTLNSIPQSLNPKP